MEHHKLEEEKERELERLEHKTAHAHHSPVMTQPGRGEDMPRDWHTGVFECAADGSTCLLGCFCMPCMMCWLSEKMGESCWMPICVPGALIPLRTKLRTMEHIAGSIMDDCCVAACCAPCGLCQLKREWDVVGKTHDERRHLNP